jgi:hypothetical protein
MNEITREDTEYGVRYVRADEAQATFEKLNSALNAWHEKTDWVQETAQPLELGMHRADVLKQRIERLRAIEEAAKNLVKVKGRYHTEQAFNKLKELVQ